VTPQAAAIRTRSPRGEGDRLRQEIVDATARLLAETGDEHAVSIRSIAETVGVTPPSIYLHFADKTELLLAVCEDRFEELDRRTEAAAAGAADPLDEIRRRGEAYVRFGLENPEHYRILFMNRFPAGAWDPERMAKACAFDHMVEAVQRAMDAAMLPSDDGALVTAIGMWAAVHGIVSLLIAKPEFPWPPVETLVRHITRAYAPS
jgi:AcrR family transcriptional regulator